LYWVGGVIGYNAGMERLERTALWLSVFTVAYNLIEGGASVAFAAADRSPALLGFGTDSFVESLSGAVMIWRFWRPEGAARREHRAAKLVGVSLVALAAFVAYEAASVLAGSEGAGRSLAALVIAAVSIVVMTALFWIKRRTARRLGSRSLAADSKQTLGCMLLSVALVAGAGLNFWTGWWQADPIAGLVIAAYLAWEGYRALAGGELCACG
jgi:Co/Zn/Cd efflux system component